MSFLSHSPARSLFCLLLFLPLQAARAQEHQIVRPTQGYVFIEGQYIAPPYDVTHDKDAVVINGHRVDKSSFDVPDWERDRESFGPRGGRNRRWQRDAGPRENWRRQGQAPLARVASQFSNDVNSLSAIKVLYEGQKPLTLFPSGSGVELLAALAGEPGFDFDPTTSRRFNSTQLETWNRLVREFQPDETFLARVGETFDELRDAEEAGERISGSNWLIANLSYPLTVFAMVVIVLAFGHLLAHKPTLDPPNGEDVGRPSVVPRSLLIIAAFSTLDLIWTLSASYAGTMRELNPLGSRFIEDPLLLVAFKIAVTGSSIGILYALQRRPLAQVASWWCCLLLTLLTARWVVFQSMFA